MPSSAKRDELRAHLFNKAHTKPRSEIVKLFGIDVEFRQPTIGAILDAQKVENPAEQAAMMIVRFAYVPGTDELVFESGDIASITQWPFGEDMQRVQDVIGRLTALDVEATKKELANDPLDKAS